MPLQTCLVHTIIELCVELIYGTWRVTNYVCRTSNKRANEDVFRDICMLQRTEESGNEREWGGRRGGEGGSLR